MLRPVTSGVSALSGFVANGHQTMHHVSSSPSKIPYGGFSPVRLQTGLLNGGLRSAEFHHRLIRRQWHGCIDNPVFPHRVGLGQGKLVPSGPEALGSASGCIVPARHRLLWPHPRLWSSPAVLGRLRLRRRVFARRPRPELPQFKLRVFRSVPLPLLRRPGGLRLFDVRPH